MSGLRQIRRALVSVYDKDGLDDLIRALGEAGVEIVSTGNTAIRVESLRIKEGNHSQAQNKGDQHHGSPAAP